MLKKEMFDGVVNSPVTTLMGVLDSTATTLTVLDASVMPDPPNLLVIGAGSLAETVKVTQITGNQLTVERAFQGSAKSWPQGTLISRNYTEYDHAAFKENILELSLNFDGKVDKEEGKGLSSNNYTDLDKQKVNAVPDNITEVVTTIENKVDKVTGKGLSTNDYTTLEKEKLASIIDIDGVLSNKVDKVEGKGLSSTDFTQTEKNKLKGVADSANNYTHPDTPGNKHIPSGGVPGNYLSYNANGEAKWTKLSEKFPVTFGSGRWTASAYVVNSTDISVMTANYFSPTNIVEVIAGDAMNKEQLDAWRAANVLKAEWNSDCTTLTFTYEGDKPTINFTVNLVIRRD